MPTLRNFTNDDLLAYNRLCSICYSYPSTDVPEPKTEEQLRTMRGVFGDNGELLSAMTQHPYDSLFCGHPVKLCGIGGVVTDPTSRSGGNVRKIFETDLPRMYEEGFVFSALYPFSYYFYGKFGYTWTEFWRHAEIVGDKLRKDLCKADEIIRVLPGEDDQGMRAIHEQYVADKDLPVLRDAAAWENLRSGTPWEKMKYAYVLRIGGKPVSYWIGQMEKQNRVGTMRIIDMAWTCPQGMQAIFAMMRGMNELDKVAMRTYPGFDPRNVVTEAYDVNIPTPGIGMTRVINVEKALSLLPAPAIAGKVTICVTDEQIEENCGCFTVTGDGNVLKVEKNVAEPDIECSIQGLTALVMGRQSFKDAIAGAVVMVNDTLDDRFAEMLFAERRIHMNRNF